jgi:hypothetical protein
MMLRLLRFVVLITLAVFAVLTATGAAAATIVYYDYALEPSAPSTSVSTAPQNAGQFTGPVKFDPRNRSLVQIYGETSAEVDVLENSVEKTVVVSGNNFLCSGFFVDTIGTIVTADHCANYQTVGSKISQSFADDGKEVSEIRFTSFVLTGIQNGSINTAALRRPSTLTVLETGSLDSDEAILRADRIDRPSVPLTIASHKPAIGGIVQSVGYPGNRVSDYMIAHRDELSVQALDIADFEATVVEGTVDGWTPSLGPTHKSAVGVTGKAATPGMSGGPTVNQFGEVVGVNSFSNSVDFTGFTVLDDLRAKLDRLQVQVSYSTLTASEEAAYGPAAFDIIATTKLISVEPCELLAVTVALSLLTAAIRPFRQRSPQQYAQQAVAATLPVQHTYLHRAS